MSWICKNDFRNASKDRNRSVFESIQLIEGTVFVNEFWANWSLRKRTVWWNYIFTIQESATYRFSHLWTWWLYKWLWSVYLRLHNWHLKGLFFIFGFGGSLLGIRIIPFLRGQTGICRLNSFHESKSMWQWKHSGECFRTWT